MFIGAEVHLDLGFDAVQAGLANLVRGDLLRRASDGAYHEWQACLAQIWPWVTALGTGLVQVRVRDMVTHADCATWTMRWEVTGPGGSLFPALDADIKLIPAGPDATVLAVAGVCRPPLVRLADVLDPAVTREVAQALIQALTSRVAASVADPAGGPDAGHGTMRPGPAPGAGYRMAC